MRRDLRWKSALIFLAVAIFGFIISPAGKNMFFGKHDPIRLGLDLKGGIELLLAPDYRVGVNPLSKLGEELVSKLQEANIPAPRISPLGTVDGDRQDGLLLTFANESESQRAMNIGVLSSKLKMDVFGETMNFVLEPKFKGSTPEETNVSNVIELTVTRDPRDFPEDALERSLTIIDHRISEASASMAEADVRLDEKGNSKRIIVQLPGLKTLQEARNLIVATGRLTFRIDNRIVLDGTDMGDMGVSFQPGKGYVIHFQFKGNGAKQLEKITTENRGKKMSVYLDESMLMDPVIEDAIPGGEGIITFGGNTTKEEVERNAILMKSGALPISLRVIQSTQVAPTLGAEIVKQSFLSAIIGIVLVIAFMLIFYGMPGLLADFALIMYAVFVLGVMALFRGVLTLPGVAGFILSLGMAVDANIIIFERIKDEIRNGKRVRPAIQSGFDRAFITILDSNLTTLISAGVLFFFGSGPVQGFAVTLAIGVLISMVTAIFVTRIFLEWRVDHDPDRYAKHFGVKEVMQ